MHHTITLKTLIDCGYDLNLDKYPIFNEEYRRVLNQKIIDRYLFNEIAFETPQRFMYELEACMYRIMNYYNDLYNAYAELEGIGFDKLLNRSIGSNSDVKSKHFGLNKANGETNSTDTLNTQDQTLYGSNDTTSYGEYDEETQTYKKGLKTTNEQTADSKSLTLHADTPQQGVNDNLSDNWGTKAFISSADKSADNSGKTEQEQTGQTTTSRNGDDTTKHTGTNENKATSENITKDHALDKTETINYNFDYMETYKKILEVLTNIDLKILDELRFLFLTVY